MGIVKPYTFVAGNKARANEVNENFDLLYQQVNSNISNITHNENDIAQLGSSKANINGSSTQRFAVANPVSNSDAVNKWYMLKNSLPPGFVVFCGFETVPEGYLICNGSAISRTTYSELFNAIGTLFGSGDGSTTFNIPDLIDKFIQGHTTVGTVRYAGLPNITGDAKFCAWANTGASGALGGTSYVYTFTQGGYNTPTNVYANSNMNIDASRSSGIYGASNTVQPPAVTMLPIIKY